MKEFEARLYKVAMIHWVDLPKKTIDALKKLDLPAGVYVEIK